MDGIGFNKFAKIGIIFVHILHLLEAGAIGLVLIIHLGVQHIGDALRDIALKLAVYLSHFFSVEQRTHSDVPIAVKVFFQVAQVWNIIRLAHVVLPISGQNGLGSSKNIYLPSSRIQIGAKIGIPINERLSIGAKR